MSLSFDPKTRLEKILCGIQTVVAKTRLEKAVKYAVENAGSGGGGLPDFDNEDDGKVLTVDGNEAKWKNPADPTMVYAVTGTIGEDAETHKETVTLNKTVSDIWDAANAGKQFKATMENVPISEGVTATVAMIVPIEIFQVALESGTVYTIKARVDATSDDALFMVEGLAASDTVVLTEV